MLEIHHYGQEPSKWSSSSGAKIERDLIEMTGEGEPGSWFLARKSGRNCRDMELSGSNATSLGSPLSACTSLHLLLEARETRKAVLRVRCFREDCVSGS